MREENKGNEEEVSVQGSKPRAFESGEAFLDDVELERQDEAGVEPEDDVIELTDLVDDSSVDDGGEPLPLAGEAMRREEDEIIDLVEAVEEASGSDEEVLELKDFIEEEPLEEEQDLSVAAGLSVSDDEQGVESLDEDAGVVVPEDGPSIAGADETVEDLDLVLETEEAPVDEMVVLDEGAPRAIHAGLVEGLSEERIEEIIAKVVREEIEKKADRILLEVAEAAIQKEIEKIKRLL